jgi:hypothetical protein
MRGIVMALQMSARRCSLTTVSFILAISSALSASPAFRAAAVCLALLVFDPKTTVPPITTAIALIIATGSNRIIPIVRAQQDLHHHWRNTRHKRRLQAPAATRKNLHQERAPGIDLIDVDPNGGGYGGQGTMTSQLEGLSLI